MKTTDEIAMQLETLARKIYTQGDNFYAYRTKKGRYEFGYTNDYPLQHGDGVRNQVDEEMAKFLVRAMFIL